MAIERKFVVDHVLFVVKDLAASRRFYAAALHPLGFDVMDEKEEGVSFGREGADDFAVFQARPGEETTTAAHVAFAAESAAAVGALLQVATASGGRRCIRPGLPGEH